MNKPFKIIYSAMFLAVCALPLALKPIAGSSEKIGKNALAETPELFKDGSLNNDFSADCEAWFGDRIPFRSELLSAAGFLTGEVLHAPVSNVICGKDGWLYFTDEQHDFMNTNAMTDQQIQAAAVTLSLMQESVTAAGGRFVFVPVPNKSTVYPEYMPSCYRQAAENNLSRLTAALKAQNICFVDLKEVLTGVKEQNVYHKRDTHWNNLGALYAYNAVMDALGAPHNSYNGADYLYEKNWRGDLDKLLYPAGGILDWQYHFQIDFQKFRFTGHTKEKDPLTQLEIYMSDQEDNDMRIQSQNLGSPKNQQLYMVRDSFGRAVLPFFIDNYKSAAFIRTNRPDVSRIAAGTDVVYEIVERNLQNVIATAPYLFAPERDASVLGHYSDGGSIEAFCENEGYAVKLYGTIPNLTETGDGRVYIRLKNDERDCIFEAFPICEENLLQDSGSRGYSMFLDLQYELNGDYEMTVMTGSQQFSAGNIRIQSTKENET